MNHVLLEEETGHLFPVVSGGHKVENLELICGKRANNGYDFSLNNWHPN